MNASTAPKAVAQAGKDRTEFLSGLNAEDYQCTAPAVGEAKVNTCVCVFDDGPNAHPVMLALRGSGFALHNMLSATESRTLAAALVLAADHADRQVEQKRSVQHIELHEAPHTLAVVRPINRKRATPLDVKLYALGRGVTVHAERSDLAGREGAFELEANGKFFVFDPSQACVTQGFVSSIERDVTAIGLKLQAKNGEDPAQGRAADGHWLCSQKTTIVSLPTAIGKTTMALALAERLGLNIVVDDWAPTLLLMPEALHLTSQEVPA